MPFPCNFEMVAFYNVSSSDATGKINNINQYVLSDQLNTIAL
jgi:hypothetical protein